MDTVKGAVTVFLILLSFAFTAHAKTETGKACMSCHTGIESIREEGSGMMAMIKALGHRMETVRAALSATAEIQVQVMQQPLTAVPPRR